MKKQTAIRITAADYRCLIAAEGPEFITIFVGILYGYNSAGRQVLPKHQAFRHPLE